jgi:hypothetical protein
MLLSLSTRVSTIYNKRTWVMVNVIFILLNQYVKHLFCRMNKDLLSLSITEDTYLIIYLSIYGFTALVDLGRFFSSLTYTNSVGLLGLRFSPSPFRYLHTEQHKHRTNAHRHRCLEWNSNPRSSVREGEDSSCLRRLRRLRPRGHCDQQYI